MKSYPFLTVALGHGVPYGDVLAFADALRKMNGDVPQRPLDIWEQDAVDHLPRDAKSAVALAIQLEAARQAEVRREWRLT